MIFPMSSRGAKPVKSCVAVSALRSVHSVRHHERRQRIDEATVRLQTHVAKAALRTAEQQRIDTLQRLLRELRGEHAKAAVDSERAQHLAQAAADLETMIARAVFSLP